MSCRSDRRALAAANAQLRAELQQHHRELERLRVENEILREATEPLIHRAPAGGSFAFIQRLRGRFSVKQLCRIMVTDRGSFYAWVRDPPHLAAAHGNGRIGQGCGKYRADSIHGLDMTRRSNSG
jgi:hypothetical protein